MDTVIIKIYGLEKFRVTLPSLFVPEFSVRRFSDLSLTEQTSVRANRPYLRRFILKPDFRQGEYLPGVDIFEAIADDRKSLQYTLQSDFSTPKLLYRNSIQEIVESSRDAVFHKLKSSLASLGILTDIRHVEDAHISAIHFCKNALLPADLRMEKILDELYRVDINKVVDVDSKETKQGGRVLNLYSGTRERVFYEKISDSLRPKNKRKDKHHIEYEREIVEQYNLSHRQVFRYEYRLKKTQTLMSEINAALGRNYKTSVLFKDLFTPGLFKTMVLKSWRDIIKRPENQLALMNPADSLALLLHILSEAHNAGTTAHSLNKALVSYGLARGIRDHGAKQIRELVFSVWNNEHPERFTQKIGVAADLMRGIPYSNGIAFVDKAIEEFKPVTLESLRNML